METSGQFRLNPVNLAGGEAGAELELVVPFTEAYATAVALEKAAALTAGLDARVLLLAVHTLPYPVPFVCPALVHAHLVEQLMELASHCRLAVQPQVVLTRDRMEGFRYAMKPASTVLVATCKRHFWPTPEEKLARDLVRDGHHVALLQIE